MPLGPAGAHLPPREGGRYKALTSWIRSLEEERRAPAQICRHVAMSRRAGKDQEQKSWPPEVEVCQAPTGEVVVELESDMDQRVPPSDDPTTYCGFCCELDVPRNLLTCCQCGNSGHQACLLLDDKLAAAIRANPSWVCITCKVCSVCETPGDDDKLLFCDSCDQGVHFFCMDPPLTEAPEGNWECPECETGSMPKRKRGDQPRGRSKHRKSAAASTAASAALPPSKNRKGKQARQAPSTKIKNGSKRKPSVGRTPEVVLEGRVSKRTKPDRRKAGQMSRSPVAAVCIRVAAGPSTSSWVDGR